MLIKNYNYDQHKASYLSLYIKIKLNLRLFKTGKNSYDLTRFYFESDLLVQLNTVENLEILYEDIDVMRIKDT